MNQPCSEAIQGCGDGRSLRQWKRQVSDRRKRRIERTLIAMAELEETFREPFRMHHDGYKYHEIADRLEIPIGTVKSRIHQARQRLMEMLSDKQVK